ncbi:hypothetical protein OG298_45040 (plasmid) [Streptomyces sp. NBC_01005]|uniref:hypothetical protein n=1 Tax=Streptomyces sp. NBC_01005 TaxID=2903715 RepID=UPI002F91A4DF|nr:hypothetical protein OG298_45040 [Streptomyces sp. NBC_01005]
MSGETAAIGVGFLVAGPVGAIIGGVAGPALAAAAMWRSRHREHDENTNQNGAGTGNSGRDSSGNGRGNGGRNSEGTGRNNSPGGGQHRTPNGNGNGRGNGTDGTGNHRKPKVKDPVADKLAKLGKGLGDKLKNRDKNDKAPKSGKGDGSGKGKGGNDPKGGGGKAGADGGAKGLKDGLKLNDRGKQPSSQRPWRDRGDKDKKERGKDDDASSSTARDGLDPKGPKGGGDLPPKPDYDPDEYIDAELVDDDLPPKPDTGPEDIIDGEVIDEDRIALVRAQREKKRRRAAVTAGKKAAADAARDGTQGDPHRVKLEVIRQENHRIDLDIHHEDQLLNLTAAAETPRSPVNYPAVQAAPAGTRTAGAAVARQIDFRGSTAYAILRAMADQLANGLHSDDDADMADHIVELTGIPNMCKNLSTAVQEAGRALARTAPLHPSVIKHLNNAAVAARTAGVMSENIMVVFVQAHREDIIRVLDPRIGEERWNIRNAPGTLDAAKLRAAIASAHSARLALPGGSSSGGGQGGSKLVPASDGSTKKLINLMKGFTRGHMVVVLSEVAGSAAGVDAVAGSIGKLYRRMTKTWPTEGVVDETVARTAGQVRRVSDELKKAIRAAEKVHQRELTLNAKGRAGKGARAERKWDVVGRRGSSE